MSFCIKIVLSNTQQGAEGGQMRTCDCKNQHAKQKQEDAEEISVLDEALHVWIPCRRKK